MRAIARTALAVAVLAFPFAAEAGAPARAELPPPRPDAEARAAPPEGLAAPVLQAVSLSGRTGYALMDLETGEMLESARAGEAFPPASVAKIFTALYALETLGPGHRFATRLVAESAPEDGRVAGDVALVGGGDPELDTDALAELAAQAQARGLREVGGDYLVEAALWPEIPRIDPEQPEEAPYNPAVSSLNLDFNRVLFTWAREGRDYELTLEARGLRESAPPSRVSIALGEPERGVFGLRTEAGREAWSVIPGALGRGGKRWLPVRGPSMHAADVFRSLAARKGAELPEPQAGRAPEAGVALATRRSRPLEEILADMLDYSTNLTAEVAGLAATRARGEGAVGLAESGAAMSRWARARAAMGAGPSAPPPAKPEPAPERAEAAEPSRAAPAALSAGIAATMLRRATPGLSAAAAPAAEAAAAPGGPEAGALDLRNHSGLSAESRATPAAMAAFLRAAHLRGEGRAGPGRLEGLLEEVKLDPRKGERRLPARAAARAKTGTLYFVRGLAGYITAASGRRLAFAIFSSDLEKREEVDPASGRGSRGWLHRARERERRLVRAWAGGY